MDHRSKYELKPQNSQKKESMKVKIYDFRLNKDFLDMTPKYK